MLTEARDTDPGVVSEIIWYRSPPYTYFTPEPGRVAILTRRADDTEPTNVVLDYGIEVGGVASETTLASSWMDRWPIWEYEEEGSTTADVIATMTFARIITFLNTLQ